MAEAACSSEDEDDGGRKVRGRPRLADTDRVRRRLESRKKYDCRRVYLGETHGAWLLRREQGADPGGGAWTDAKLAAHLLQLEARGKPGGDPQMNVLQEKGHGDGVNNLLSLVSWYCDHKSLCPHEPDLLEVSSSPSIYVRAVWQCQGGHHFFQDLHWPLKTLHRIECEEEADSDDSSSTSRVQSVGCCTDPERPAHAVYSQDVTEAVCSDDTRTVVCMPISDSEAGLFDGVAQEALSQVVAAGCPSQVIIIAGAGYEALATEGIQLNMVDGRGGGEGVNTTLEPDATFTQPDTQHHEEETRDAPAITDAALYSLQQEEEEAQRPDKEEDHTLILSSPLPEVESVAGSIDILPMQEAHSHSEATQHVSGEQERKKKRSQVTDADGVLEMFHCPYEGCDQVYTALNSFKNHISLVHRKGRTKVCPEAGCGKKFYLSHHLRRHMIIHTGIREFICETCGKSFKRKSHLEVHRRTHTGETPLQCEVCGFQCRQRASLNWHMKKHGASIQYNFSCEQCGKLFEKRDSVKFHKLKSHPEGGVT